MKHDQRYSLGTYGLKQCNSLQNLLDDSHYQSSSNQSHTSGKKHKNRKNSTSVSTRRLEGGSLPIDMHHSSAVQSPPDQPFLSEYKNNKKRKEKQQTLMDAVDNETDEKKIMQRHFEAGSSKDVSWLWGGGWEEKKKFPVWISSSFKTTNETSIGSFLEFDKFDEISDQQLSFVGFFLEVFWLTHNH